MLLFPVAEDMNVGAVINPRVADCDGMAHGRDSRNFPLTVDLNSATTKR